MVFRRTPIELLTQKIGLSNGRNLFWTCHDEKNFGDWIGPYIFHKLTSSHPVYCQARIPSFAKVYFTVGSILHHIRTANSALVWGSGIIDSQTTFAPPKNIFAVRGPYTRERCRYLGYECPNIFGDPALLMPLLFKPNINKEFELGIVSHMVDFTDAKKRFAGKGVNVVDVCQPVETVVREILKCEAIASSSLHGIILAHAYGIKAVRIPLSNRLKGDGIKFEDYYQCFKKPLNNHQLTVSSDVKLSNLVKHIANLPIPDVEPVQNKLLRCCPFPNLI